MVIRYYQHLVDINGLSSCRNVQGDRWYSGYYGFHHLASSDFANERWFRPAWFNVCCGWYRSPTTSVQSHGVREQSGSLCFRLTAGEAWWCQPACLTDCCGWFGIKRVVEIATVWQHIKRFELHPTVSPGYLFHDWIVYLILAPFKQISVEISAGSNKALVRYRHT